MNKEKDLLQVNLNIRRGLDGRLMMTDHDHIDIILMPDKKKIISFAKLDFSDIVYDTQSRLFDFLVNKGICTPESVQGGNVYGSIEAKIAPLEQTGIPIEQLVSLNIEKWLKKEMPALQMDKEYSEKFTDYLTEPEAEDSTELGEVPQEEDKGTIPKYASRRYIGGWW